MHIAHTVFFHRVDARDDFPLISYSDIDASRYPRDVVRFPSGENDLCGCLYGKDSTRSLILLAHGIGSCADDHLAETTRFVDDGRSTKSVEVSRAFELDTTYIATIEDFFAKSLAQER